MILDQAMFISISLRHQMRQMNLVILFFLFCNTLPSCLHTDIHENISSYHEILKYINHQWFRNPAIS